MDEITVAMAAIGLVTAILALVVKPLFNLLNANTVAQSKLTVAFENVATTNALIAEETKQVRLEAKKGNEESERRNGHLAEISVTGNATLMEGLSRIDESNRLVLSTLRSSAILLAADTAITMNDTKNVARDLRDTPINFMGGK